LCFLFETCLTAFVLFLLYLTYLYEEPQHTPQHIAACTLSLLRSYRTPQADSFACALPMPLTLPVLQHLHTCANPPVSFSWHELIHCPELNSSSIHHGHSFEIGTVYPDPLVPDYRSMLQDCVVIVVSRLRGVCYKASARGFWLI
jgi:hypothetical protein